jgi:hypothetical protein
MTTKDDALKLALEAAEVLEALFKQAEAMHENTAAGVNVHCQITVADLSKGLYAAAALRQAIEQAEQAQPYADKAAMFAHMKDRIRIDPVTGNVGIGTPPQAEQPVALGPVAKRRVSDYIRGAYDLGYNDARNAKAVPGDGAPGYKGRDVEADHGGALLHALESLAPPPRQPLTAEQIAELDCYDHYKFARAIERAHGITKEKNNVL